MKTIPKKYVEQLIFPRQSVQGGEVVEDGNGGFRPFQGALGSLISAYAYPIYRVRWQQILSDLFSVTSWNKLSDGLPQSGKRVMFVLENSQGKKWHCFGFYAAEKTISAEDWENEEAAEYDPKTDLHWCPEGWHEEAYSSEFFFKVDGKVIAWREAPSLEGL